MEQKQLQRIKITATNIKSVLISKNKKIVKLDRTKSVLVKRKKEEERKKQMEASVEKSNLGPVKKVFASISTPGKSFLSKVLNFFGFIITGYMVKFLPKIIKGIGDFINFIKPIWDTFAKVLGFVGTIIQGIFNTFNPRKTSKELDNLDKELKIANADADEQLDELGDVVQSNKEQETTQQGPVESSTDNNSAEFDSNPSVTPPPEQGTPVQALNEGGTLQNPMNFSGLPSLGGGGGGTDAITAKAMNKSVGTRTRDIGNLFARPFRKGKTDPRSQFATDINLGFQGGGIVPGYEGGGLIGGKNFMQSVKNRDYGWSIKPPKPSIVQAYKDEQAKIITVGGDNNSSKSGGKNDLPDINAAAKRSLPKIKTLGISV